LQAAQNGVKVPFKLILQTISEPTQVCSEERKFADRDGIVGQDFASAPTFLLSAFSKGLNHKDFSKRRDLARSMLTAHCGYRNAQGDVREETRECFPSRWPGCIRTERVGHDQG
jgi:hypothetical protein